ncbi:MAG TPA: TetR/AcrR family transcriptional regulator [Rhizomicrobium sp.]|nr:TetR/AcrR family transcriptional regulator [Rhizomicrobium sp.]
MVELGPFASDARNLNKSARTRAKLMDAAVGIFAREGFEAASVNRIAQAADVVNGTFYLHFKDKDEIAGAVAFAIAAQVVRRLDDAMAGIDDAAERVACATRRFVEFALERPDWGLAFFRANWFFPQLRRDVTAYLRADLERGVKQGAFTATINDHVVDIVASMTLVTAFGRLRNEAGPTAGEDTAEMQLRLLGVPPKRAHRIAHAKLPPLKL